LISIAPCPEATGSSLSTIRLPRRRLPHAAPAFADDIHAISQRYIEGGDEEVI